MSVLSPGRNLVLIGLMGAGKTTVGALVAELLDRPFVDTDAVIERETGQSASEIFAAAGERGFRRIESAAIRRVAAIRGQIIAVGGGAVLDPANVTQLRSTGDLVLLDADPATLAQRVGDGAGRPLLAGAPAVDHLTTLRHQRAAAYGQAAGHTIDTTGMEPAEVAQLVLAWAGRQAGLLSRDELGP